jgi:polysaccharide export outer membrane protein
MIFRKILLTFVCINLLTGFLFLQEKDSSYKIGPEDLIEINVFNVPELSKIIRVAQDGSINLALIGKTNISGLTRFELEKRLATLLEKKYLKNPQVTVFIKEYKSQSISIIGAVRNPGRYNLFAKKNNP